MPNEYPELRYHVPKRTFLFRARLCNLLVRLAPPMYVIQEHERSARKQSLISLLGTDLIRPSGRSLGWTETAAVDPKLSSPEAIA
jgi:hypothetical protein